MKFCIGILLYIWYRGKYFSFFSQIPGVLVLQSTTKIYFPNFPLGFEIFSNSSLFVYIFPNCFLTVEIFPNFFNDRNFLNSSLTDSNHCKITVIQNSSPLVLYHKVYLWKSRESLQGRILVQKNIWGKNFDFQEKYLPLMKTSCHSKTSRTWAALPGLPAFTLKVLSKSSDVCQLWCCKFQARHRQTDKNQCIVLDVSLK